MRFGAVRKNRALVVSALNMVFGLPVAALCTWKSLAGLSVGGTLAGLLVGSAAIGLAGYGRRQFRLERKWPACAAFAAAVALSLSALAIVVSAGWIAVGVNFVLALGLFSLAAASYLHLRRKILGYTWMRRSLALTAAVSVPSAAWSYFVGLAQPLAASSAVEFGSYALIAGWSLAALGVSSLPAFKRSAGVVP